MTSMTFMTTLWFMRIDFKESPENPFIFVQKYGAIQSFWMRSRFTHTNIYLQKIKGRTVRRSGRENAKKKKI